MPTKSQLQANDISALWRARNPLLWVVTKEEQRTERYLIEAASAAGYVTRTWDVAQGVCDISGNVIMPDKLDPDSALDEIKARAVNSRPGERCVWIMRDLAPWLSGPGGMATQRRVRNLARMLPGVVLDRAQAIVILSAGGDVPAELAGHATVIDWPLPDREEIADILDAAVASLPDEMQKTACPNGNRDAAIDAAVGLSGEEAAACYARSLVQLRKIDPATVSNEKRRVIARERVLEWHDPLPGGLDVVGGLENLKAWLVDRAKAYKPAARAYGLPAPKGIVIVGVSGCGKTLTSKAVASAWGIPLLRLDMGALKSKFVGESEGNLRKALKVIEAIGRCVVWIDEIEKAMQGATSGSADGGVAADALGTVLSWMQERQGEAFVIATANDVSALPPELLRKGRFDELFFVDLPNETERASVLHAALRQHGRDPDALKLRHADLVRATEGFTGSEIASLVPDAMFAAFGDDGREINSADLIAVATLVVPLSKTADKKIAELRAWSTGRARPASKEAAAPTTRAARVLDVA
jgi:hypothetical protein